MTPLMWACFHNNEKAVKKLLKHGADINEKDVDGKTAMHWVMNATPQQAGSTHP
jgi:ankyrin repeat protein